VIVRPEVFEDSHLPRRLLHREAEVDELLRAWAPAAVGQCADDILLSGPSGVGKTTFVAHARRRINEQGVRTVSVECLGRSTSGVVRQVLRDLGADPGRTTPKEDLCLALREHIDEPLVAILDEADDLVATDALDRLSDLDPISWVVICHNPDKWLARADDSIRRRLSTATLSLSRFGTTELADILEARATVGLQDGIVSRDQLMWIADEVAGNPRRGIQSLRAAAAEAERQGHEQIRDIDVERCFELAQRKILRLNLETLPFHHRLLYELIRSAGGLDASGLHEWYEGIADKQYRSQPTTPIGERDRRRKLQKLADYGLIEREGGGPHTEYVPVEPDLDAVGIHVDLD